MRTTLDIADDVLFAVKERARCEKRTAGEVISELAREALTGLHQSSTIAEEGGFYGFEPLPHRGPAVSNALIDELLDEEPE